MVSNLFVTYPAACLLVSCAFFTDVPRSLAAILPPCVCVPFFDLLLRCITWLASVNSHGNPVAFGFEFRIARQEGKTIETENGAVCPHPQSGGWQVCGNDTLLRKGL